MSVKQSGNPRLGELSLRVLDNISAMVAYWDSNLICRFANQAYLHWFGKTREQLIGTSMRDLLGPLYQKNLPYILGVLGGEPQIFERDIQTPHGVIVNSIATYTPDIVEGTVRGFFVHVADVTPVKAAQAEMKRAQKAAEDASRAKSEFLASMSHEIRTPLNAIVGLSQLLGHTQLSAQQSDYLRKLEVAGRSLLDIVNEILDFSKIEAGKLSLTQREFSIEDVLDELADIVATASAEKDLEVVIRIAPNVPRRLLGDPGRLKQVLINLASNAVKFTAQGEIAIEVTREADLGGASVRLCFSVRDTGIGIPADLLERIFEPFTQADTSTTRRYGGTGLGLAISRRLVGMMSGELGVKSTQGRGSTFSFSIPLGVQTQEQSRAVSASAQAEPVRALVASESPLVGTFLAECCTAFGWELTATSDAPALQSWRLPQKESQPDRDVVFINWPMREELGTPLFRALADMKDVQRPILIILTQPRASRSLNEAVQRLGVFPDEIIEKPVTASVLHKAVARARRRRSPEPESGQQDPPPPVQSPARRLLGMRLLVVDDNPINLIVTCELVGREGATVTSASSGAAALEKLSVEPLPFDAVLMDIQMPDLDGYQVTREIRKNPRLAALPVIAVSAGVLWEERDKCRSAGMNGFISKPLELEEAILLIDSLTSHAGRWQIPAGRRATPAATDPSTRKVHFNIEKFFSSSVLDKATALHLLTLFVEDNAAMQRSIRAALERGDLRGMTQALHRQSGSAAILGASRLANASRDLEVCLKQGGSARLHDELHEYEAALSEALHAARALLLTKAAPAS